MLSEFWLTFWQGSLEVMNYNYNRTFVQHYLAFNNVHETLAQNII